MTGISKRDTLPGIAAAAVLLAVFSVLTLTHFHQSFSAAESYELNRFRSDMVTGTEKGSIYTKDLAKEQIFLAYSTYLFLPNGKYRALFSFSGPKDENCRCILEITSEKGKKIEAISPEITIGNGSRNILDILIPNGTEVEPRVRYLWGSDQITLSNVRFERAGGIFPVRIILGKTVYLSPLFIFALLAFWYGYTGDERWRAFLAAFLAYTGIFMILRYAWMSEDALITLRRWAIENDLGADTVQTLSEALESLDKRYTLYSYYLSANHILISHYGLMGIIPRSHNGEVTYDENGRWRQKAGWRKVFQLFGEPSVGKPDQEAVDDVEWTKKWIDEVFPEEDIPVNGVVVFTDPAVELYAKKCPTPVVKAGDLARYLKQGLKGQPTLTTARQKELRRTLDEIIAAS